ncbi:MAG: cytochrome c oxidase assembly protein [Dehalococcoidia bacterium]|nr:cytochrome c oxidase assembly protein [Dehalococcoidia bacterium]
MIDIDAARSLLEAARPAHGAIPEGTAWWRAWSVDPVFLVPVGLMAWWYAQGLLRWTSRSREHPAWRTGLFYTGVALLVMAMESPIDRLGVHEFSMHMVQHEALMMLAVPVMLLGAPTTPLLLGLPRWLRVGVVRPLAGRAWMRALYRGLTHPIVAVGSLTVTLWVWHLVPGWYEAAMLDQKVHDLEHFTMTAAAVLFWWNVIDPKPLHSRLNPPLRLLYMFAGTMPKQLLAAMLTYAPAPLYAYYEGVRGVLPGSALEDQELAGLIMWVPSGMTMLLGMGVVFFVWANRAEAAGRAEAQAFAAEAARASSASTKDA